MLKKEITISGAPKIQKELQKRLMMKIMDKNEDKIIEKMTLRQSHVNAIKQLDREIEELCGQALGKAIDEVRDERD